MMAGRLKIWLILLGPIFGWIFTRVDCVSQTGSQGNYGQPCNNQSCNAPLKCLVDTCWCDVSYNWDSEKKTCRKLCLGTDAGLVRTGTVNEHYEMYKQKYTNCAYVEGNLELTFLEGDYDLQFLQSIEEVTGYVLIASVWSNFVPLKNLRIIRGRTLYKYQSMDYALYIALNYNPKNNSQGLFELGFKHLTEITKGKVYFHNNNALCYETSIRWQDINPTEPIPNVVYKNDTPYEIRPCGECHEACFNSVTKEKHCWGKGPDMCQKLNYGDVCSLSCEGRCFGSGQNQCCHPECAAGCHGPRKSECFACKTFYNDGMCETNCPAESIYDNGKLTWIKNPNAKYAYGSLCVKVCPEHLLQDQGACVVKCPDNKEPDANNTACVECVRPCKKTCGGTVNTDFVHQKNIQSFKDCTSIHGTSDGDNRQTYRAAVYEHAIILPPQPDVKVSREQALHNMMTNINVYETQVSEAARQGVDIIVFPEDGIYGYKMRTRDTIAPYLEYIPDPTVESWTPCTEPQRHNNTDVQVLLSCLARNHSMYLVANIGDAQPCIKADPNCKSDGQYQYNTDVVFDRTGRLIARYHKQNLFFELQFDEPVNPEYIYFDTEFGRFGIFTCFDIIFHEPAIPLIEEYNITDVVFPTAWMDALPFFSAIGYHSSFAIAHKVNFLAANLHRPQERFQGSGIYTPKGPMGFYYNRTSDEGQLVVADVPVLQKRACSSNIQQQPRIYFGSNENHWAASDDFRSTTFRDWYTFVLIGSGKGSKRVCQMGLCCYLEYERDDSGEMYALGVFDGIHKYHGPYYLQICILLRCQSLEKDSCGRLNFNANTRFTNFKLYGNFSTPYVNPQIVLSNNGSLELAPIGSVHYDSYVLQGNSTATPLLSASLVGRIYVRD